MKTLLIAGGVLFLLLAFVLFIAAVIVFFMARKRSQPQQSVPQRPAAPPQPPAAPPPPAAPAGDATVVLDTRRQSFGALLAATGPLAGRSFPIDAAGFYIGRDGTMSQVVIESPSVSKRHVWIGVKDGVVMAIDQGSTNGTFLNAPDAAITQTKLSPGDTLIISQDIARFTYQV